MSQQTPLHSQKQLVGQNSGYIGQIHQPVYNIKVY